MLWEKESNRVDALYTDLLERPHIDSIYEDYLKSRSRMTSAYGADYQKSAATAIEYRREGNIAFEKKWITAIELYNKSMCYSEESSEMMGLAYANRSSCFLNMKLFSKCLVDIKRAKKNNYPQEKMAKLDERKRVCLDKMEKETDQSEVFEPKLDYKPNEMFPCFADAVKIEHNHEYGRHIVANEDIDVGKTVMVDESYFAETINQKFQRCSVCLRMAENLKPCNKCAFAMFCPRCEENIFHDVECKINPAFFGSLGFKSFRMVAVRSVLLAMDAFPDINQLIAVVEEMLLDDAVEAPESLSDPQSKYRAFFKLQHKPKEYEDENLPQKIYLIYRLMMSHSKVSNYFRSEAHKRFAMHLMGQHAIIIKNWCRNDRCKVGRKGILGEDIEIYWEHRVSIPVSYFNHSCAPNVFITSRNGINMCVVVRPIKKGDELCVAYDKHILKNPKAQRQQELLKKFNFQCKCDRCQQPQLESFCRKSNHRIRNDSDYQSLLSIRGSPIYSYQDILSLCENAFSFLKKNKKKAWSDEILQTIYDLQDYVLIETEHSGGLPYAVGFFDAEFD